MDEKPYQPPVSQGSAPAERRPAKAVAKVQHLPPAWWGVLISLLPALIGVAIALMLPLLRLLRDWIKE